MKLGLQIPYFTWPGGPPQLGADLARIASAADGAGYDSIWVMDHHFQIPMVGAAELDMLEAYTALGFIAGHTRRATLGTLVTGVTYRNPGILIKQVSTLDVLSGGRAWLGIGAAWFEREHVGLDVRFPPLKERFERLEDALQIAHQMWSDNNGPFDGKHYHLAETLNVPQPLAKPHPRILIGGSGEKKTLRLVARYADACNLFGPPEIVRQKLEVLRGHCEKEGRNYGDIEKTIIMPMSVGPDGSQAGQLVEMLGRFAEVGVQVAIGGLASVEQITPIEAIGKNVIPQIAKL